MLNLIWLPECIKNTDRTRIKIFTAAGTKGVNFDMSKETRCGICIWETSPSIHEQADDDYKTAECKKK